MRRRRGTQALPQSRRSSRTSANDHIDCDFEWVPGYLHLPRDASKQKEDVDFQEEARLASELGFDAEFVDDVPLVGGPGVRFDNQARFHPRKYLAGLARAIVDAGGRIYEHTEVREFCDEPRSVKANGHTVTCDDIVIATHNPLMGLTNIAAPRCSRPSWRSTPAT